MRGLVDRREGIRILRYPQRAASGLAGYLVEYLPSMLFTTLWLLALRLRGRVDVIHGCNPPDLFFLLGRLAGLWGGRYVYDQHDANPELAATKWGASPLSGPLQGLTRALERASYATAAAVIATNDSYAGLAMARGGVASERIAVVRNAPPGDRFRMLAAGVEPPTDGSFRIGYLGVMGSQDGVDLLLDAIARVRTLAPGLALHVDLIGDGEARHGLAARADDLGISDRVTFHGYRPPETFVPLLAAEHVCVSPDPPTPFNDVSTMTKVVEYLAIGRPVVAFDLAETRSVIGPAGVIVTEPTADALAAALAALATDRHRLAELTALATHRLDVIDLRWERSAERLLAAYGDVLAGPETGTT